MGRLLLVVTLAFLSTCTCEQPRSRNLTLDEPLGPGEVRCGQVTRESELIGGPQAFGVVGRSYRCYNNKIRFIVQDASRPVGVSSRGGNLVDVDLIRDSEFVDGEDTFREHTGAIGGREIDPQLIEVVNEGLNGEPGVIRVSGPPVDLSLAPQAHYLSQDIQGRLQTDYIIRPDVSTVEIVTTFFNDGEPLDSLTAADFLAFGGATRLHSIERGYGEIDLFSRVSFLSAARGDKVSYAWVCEGDDLTMPFADQGTTAPFCGPGYPVRGERSVVRWLVVGDGTLESVTKQAFALRGIEFGTARARVVDDDGNPVVGALVSVLDDDGARVINESRSADDGSISLSLQPGTYRLIAHAKGLSRSEEAELTIAVGDDKSAGDLVVGRAGTLAARTRFFDLQGAETGPRPAKLTVVPVEAQTPSSVLKDFSRGGAVDYAVSANGTFSLSLPPGRYRAYVSRGFEFTRFEREVTISADAVTDLVADIQHVIDTTGYLSAELHQHSLGSVDSEVPVPIKVLENAAEGVEIAASTDHDVVTDFKPHVEKLGLTEHLFAVAGNEVSYTGIGHFNAFPWNVDAADPLRDNGSRIWSLKTVPEMFADVRAAAGDALLQINHPRATLFGYFLSLRLNPVDASRIPREPPSIPTYPATIYEDWSGAFDAVEVNGSLGAAELFTAEGRDELARRAQNDPSEVPILADYFALLGAGMKVVATGNSDTHDLDEGVGYPRNFFRVGFDDVSQMNEDIFREVVRAQRVSVGEGCLIELFVDGESRMGLDEMVDDGDITMRLQAPPHVSVGFTELYVNGEAQRLVADDAGLRIDPSGALSVASTKGTQRIDGVIDLVDSLPPDRDVVIVAISKNGGGLAPTGGGSVFCYSAPLYVDANGDGAFTGWLEDTQQVRP